MGAGRLGLFGGVILVTVATMGELSTLAWGGVALTALSLCVNSAGKVVRYNRTPIPPLHRASVVGAWLVLVTALFGLIVDYTYGQFHPGYDGFFWPLAVAVAGLAMVYQGTRSKFVTDAVAEGSGA